MNQGLKYAGVFLLGIGAGIGSMYLYDYWRKSQPVGESQVKGKGKNGEGQKIIEITGSGGKDDGVKIRGYELPANIEDNNFPLDVIVKPNEDIFGLGTFTGGKKIKFIYQRGSDVVYQGEEGEYAMWYDDLKHKALGVTT